MFLLGSVSPAGTYLHLKLGMLLSLVGTWDSQVHCSFSYYHGYVTLIDLHNLVGTWDSQSDSVLVMIMGVTSIDLHSLVSTWDSQLYFMSHHYHGYVALTTWWAPGTQLHCTFGKNIIGNIAF